MSEKTTGGIWIMVSRFGWLALQILSLPIYVRTLGESNYGAAILITNIRAFWQILDLSAPQGILQLLSKTHGTWYSSNRRTIGFLNPMARALHTNS